MSTPGAASLTFAIILLGLSLLAIGLCLAAGRVSRAEEVRGLKVWDTDAGRWVCLPRGVMPGPGHLTVREVAAVDAREISGRLAGLRQAVRDEQQKGEL